MFKALPHWNGFIVTKKTEDSRLDKLSSEWCPYIDDPFRITDD